MHVSFEASIADQFQIEGKVQRVRNIGNGYINKTYCVECLDDKNEVHKYTLQQINNNVFRDVKLLMDNFCKITGYLNERKRLHPEENVSSVATVVRTREGKSFLSSELGYWRMYKYISSVYSMDIAENAEVFYLAGKSFGQYIKDMSGLSVDSIKCPIENFHNTQSRYLALEKAIEEDPLERASECPAEIDFIRKRKDFFGTISNALESGEIPYRITHNDTNLNNILFDKKTKLPVAIIDLDTTMPSSPLYDFGDSLRIGTNTTYDDDTDLSKVKCDLYYYESYARGWLESCGSILTPRELQLLPYASRIITMEDGIRFLADYINGDIYYVIHRAKHNLQRARNQLTLAADMENKFSEILRIHKKIYSELHLKME